MPRCHRCGLTKPPSEFVKSRATKSGLHTNCKPCHIDQVKASKEKHHGSERQFLLRHRYGADDAQVAWLVLQQDGRCAVCNRKSPRHLDHDHRSGRVRGVLCFNCNGALGKIGDRIDVLSNAVDYLEGRSAYEGTDAG